MSNIPCGIIKDLMPSYCDNLCGDEANTAIETHIAECAECKRTLEAMRAAIRVEHINADTDKRAIQGISKVWKRTKKHALLKGALITAIICVTLLCTGLRLFVWRLPVKPSDVHINAYMLENGNILCEYFFVGGNPLLTTASSQLNEYGDLYAVVTDTMIKFNKVDKLFYVVYDLDEFGSDRKAKALYYGTKNDNVLIWMEGMTLSPADKYLEEQYGKN